MHGAATRVAFAVLVLSCGPAVTPPPETTPAPMAAPIPTVAQDASVVAVSAEPSSPAPIEDASVRRTDIGPGVAEMRGRFRACYNRGLLSDPNLQGGLVLDVAIGPDGSVTSVVSKQNTLPLDVTVCLEKVVRTLLIDPPDASIHVSIPIRFVPP